MIAKHSARFLAARLTFGLRPDRSRILGALMAATVLLGASPVVTDQGARAEQSQVFSSDDLIHGKTATQSDCASGPLGVWVSVGGRGECIRYYLSNAGGLSKVPVVYMRGDILPSPQAGRDPAVPQYYIDETYETLQRNVDSWSRVYQGTYILLARPGTYGSSGRELDRRSNREAQLIDAALDAIKARHGYRAFNLVGQSGGGHLVAAMVARRHDVGCAVMASAVLAVAKRAEEAGRPIAQKYRATLYDPIDHVAEIRTRPGLRMIVVSNPDDRTVPIDTQLAYVEALRKRAIPVATIEARSFDDAGHDLARHGIRAAIACAKGTPFEGIKQVVMATQPPVEPAKPAAAPTLVASPEVPAAEVPATVAGASSLATAGTPPVQPPAGAASQAQGAVEVR